MPLTKTRSNYRRSRSALAILIAIATVVLVGLGGAGPAAAAPRTADAATVPITGTLADGTGDVTGTFEVTRFANQGGTLMAIGDFTGSVTDAMGNTVSGTDEIALPVNLQQSSGTCEILTLVLGPLDLDLLGLQVHLDQVVLEITAQRGPGNLLGNLLCAIAGLLDGPTGINAIISQIASLLNQLLGILR